MILAGPVLKTIMGSGGSSIAGPFRPFSPYAPQGHEPPIETGKDIRQSATFDVFAPIEHLAWETVNHVGPILREKPEGLWVDVPI
jgi:hypothetical protein